MILTIPEIFLYRFSDKNARFSTQIQANVKSVGAIAGACCAIGARCALYVSALLIPSSSSRRCYIGVGTLLCPADYAHAYKLVVSSHNATHKCFHI